MAAIWLGGMSRPNPCRASAYSSGGKTKIASSLRQHVGAIPIVVSGELRFQSFERFLPSFEFVLFKKGSNAVQIVRVSTQFRLDFHTRGIDNARFGHLLDHALLQNLGNRFVSRLQTGVGAKARDGCGTAVGRSLRIEQNLQSAEDSAARIEKRNVVGALEILLFEIEMDFPDHDLQILLNLLLLPLGRGRLELFEHSFGFPPLLIFVRQRGLRRFRVELA